MRQGILFILAIVCICISCNQVTDESSKELNALSDSVSISGVAAEDVKLVKTAAINFKVKDVEDASRSVSQLARKTGGMIFNQTLQSVENERKELKISPDSLLVITSATRHCDITARVPSDSLEEFLYNVASLGYYTETSTLNIDDKSLDYLDNKLKQKNRREIISDRVSKATTGSRTQALQIKDEMVDRYIENRVIDADARYSAVNLTLFQNPTVRKEMIANYMMSDYRLSFMQRLRNALKDGWQYFLSFIIVLADIWVLIFFLLLTYLTYRYFQKKKLQILPRN